MVKSRKMRDSAEDKILYTIVNIVLMVILLLVLYPLIYIISSSFSSGAAVMTGKVVLWPVEPSLNGYRAVFSHKDILSGYSNTIFYTTVGTLINVAVTMVAAYPLSRRDFPIRKFGMLFCTLTMFFSGGLIPFYILMVNLHFVNTIWVMLIPGALSVYNMILVRTFILSSIPLELIQASQIDGCSDLRYFFDILLPLSKPVIAVITLFYAVGHWNSYFNAMIYLSDRSRYPLQLILREVLVSSKINMSDLSNPDEMALVQGLESLLKYALIVVSSAPIIAVYPLVQKHFIKGVMIGSIKG